jgi:hypothetical protein
MFRAPTISAYGAIKTTTDHQASVRDPLLKRWPLRPVTARSSSTNQMVDSNTCSNP